MAITKRSVKPHAAGQNQENDDENENNPLNEEQQQQDLTDKQNGGEEEEDDVEKSEEEDSQGEDESEEDEEKSERHDFNSDSESESEPETVVVKPIASKPMNGGQPKPDRKRVVDDDEKVMDMKNKKKAKLSNGKSKSSAKRVWSDDDEVVILNGLIQFRAKKGKDAKEDMQSFYDFIKGSVKVVDVTKTQISDKVRRLRQKYEAYADKAKRGKKIVFPKPHEQELYEISSKVWGNESEGAASKRVGENEGASKHEVKKSGASDVGKKVIEDGDFAATYPDLYAELESEDSSLGARLLMKRSLSKIGHAKLKALDEEWKAAHVDEAKLLGKRSELTHKMALAATE